MQYSEKQYPLQQETGTIIGLAMEVHNTLGFGFLEAVYQEALEYELTLHGIPFSKQKCFKPEFDCYSGFQMAIKYRYTRLILEALAG